MKYLWVPLWLNSVFAYLERYEVAGFFLTTEETQRNFTEEHRGKYPVQVMNATMVFLEDDIDSGKKMQPNSINEITSSILKCAFTVHTAMGPGLLESSYEECMCYEMNETGLLAERQLPLPLVYKAVKLDVGYRVDFRIEQKVIVEIKACEALNDVHVAQVLTYPKLSGCTIGLLINFNVLHLKQGIRRLIL